MHSKPVIVKSFRDMAKAIHAEDVRKAQNLRRSQGLAKNRKSNNGPRIAR